VSGAARFTELARVGAARAGTLNVRGKPLQTPAFLPVGTYGAVKGVPPTLLASLGTRMLLANACHLHDRPGADIVARLGGLHRLMGWDGLILTDSGGFQVFSLLERTQLDEQGATFRSPVDGRELRLGPTEAVDIQLALDSDIAMVFDHCPPLPSPREALERAVERTTRWARLARERHHERSTRGQALFAIVQGGLDDELRERSARELVALELDGYAIGGLSVGESKLELRGALQRYAPLLPADRLRYVMGVGAPGDVLAAICAGFDVFDCVLPTRNARHGTLFTRGGALHLRNARWRDVTGPVDEGCDCPACTGFPLGALRHLFMAGDPLAILLASAHNLRFMHRLVAAARNAILEGRDPAALAAETGCPLPAPADQLGL
jgi:queuine tRNA-ribosyltransferase